MKKIFSILFMAISVLTAAFASDYQVDPGHSTIGFEIRHLFTTVHGRFTDFRGTIHYDKDKPQNSTVNFTVKINSLDTSNAMRDKDLRSPNFFDVDKFPEATFSSTRVVFTGNNQARLIGNLTIHGVTKPVGLDIEFLGEGKDPWGKTRGGFTATTTLSRKDFGIVWNKVMEGGDVLIGDTVNLKIDAEAIEKTP